MKERKNCGIGYRFPENCYHGKREDASVSLGEV
jgi:hypothetical protein